MSEDRRRLDEILASAAGDQPSDADLARLEARLAPLFGPPPGGPAGDGGGGAAGAAGAAGTAGSAGGGAIGKWLAGAAAAAAIGGGGYATYRATRSSQPPPAIAVTADAGVPAEIAVAVAVADAAPVAVDAAVAPEPPGRPAPADALAAEARMLGRGQTALAGGDARGALRWVDRHARRFPSGALVEERERLAIEALLRLGRRADAEARAERFHRRFPRSVQWPRVRELLDRDR